MSINHRTWYFTIYFLKFFKSHQQIRENSVLFLSVLPNVEHIIIFLRSMIVVHFLLRWNCHVLPDWHQSHLPHVQTFPCWRWKNPTASISMTLKFKIYYLKQSSFEEIVYACPSLHLKERKKKVNLLVDWNKLYKSKIQNKKIVEKHFYKYKDNYFYK